jgi:hypothetical protein
MREFEIDVWKCLEASTTLVIQGTTMAPEEEWGEAWILKHDLLAAYDLVNIGSNSFQALPFLCSQIQEG